MTNTKQKTYKTSKGLQNALKKVLGTEATVSKQSGILSKGWIMVPIEGQAFRIIRIDITGYPTSLESEELNTLLNDFGATGRCDTMFGGSINYAEIALEVKN